jgi:hypothetical protein
MVFGLGVFGLGIFAYPSTGDVRRGTWTEICKSKNEWEVIPRPNTSIRRCEDAS